MSVNFNVSKKPQRNSIDRPRNGLGTFAYSDGRIYVGEFKGGSFHGLVYVGEFTDGKKDGEGTLTHPERKALMPLINEAMLYKSVLILQSDLGVCLFVAETLSFQSPI